MALVKEADGLDGIEGPAMRRTALLQYAARERNQSGKNLCQPGDRADGRGDDQKPRKVGTVPSL